MCEIATTNFNCVAINPPSTFLINAMARRFMLMLTLSADDSVCNEIQKAINNSHVNIVNPPSQHKSHEKVNLNHALNGSAHKTTPGMFSVLLFLFCVLLNVTLL